MRAVSSMLLLLLAVSILACGKDDAAPADTVEATRERITELESRLAKVEARVGELEAGEPSSDGAAPNLGVAEDLVAPPPDPGAPLERPLVHAAPPVEGPAPTGPTDRVSLFIRTPGVKAEVVGEAGEVLGHTNVPGGVRIPRSEAPVKLVLRAGGYRDMPLSLVPNRNKMVVKELVGN